MDKLPSDVTAKINSTMKSISDSLTGILANSITYITSLYFNHLFIDYGTVLLDLYVKDHEKFIPAIGKFFKGERKVFVVDLLKDLNYTLKSYIQGQVTVSFILGIILYIGYTLIGLPYTPLLVLFAGVANLIPF